MKYFFAAASLLLFTSAAFSQSADETAVRNILANQTASWNKGNLEEFMQGYWHNDSLAFIGKSGITYGYTNTLNNYKKNYSSPEQMGKLFFEFIKVKKISTEYYWVLGKFFLKRTIGDVSGHYTLLFRKINGKWLIVSDHSS